MLHREGGEEWRRGRRGVGLGRKTGNGYVMLLPHRRVQQAMLRAKTISGRRKAGEHGSSTFYSFTSNVGGCMGSIVTPYIPNSAFNVTPVSTCREG